MTKSRGVAVFPLFTWVPSMDAVKAKSAATPEMLVSTLLVSELILAGGFGLLLLFVPQWLLGLISVPPAPESLLLTRLYGPALLYVAFLHARYFIDRSAPALRSLALANMGQDILSAIVLALGTLQGTLNAVGWLLAGTFVMMTLLNALTVRHVVPAAATST